MDVLFGFGNQLFEVCPVYIIANDDEVYALAVEPNGHFAGQIGRGHITNAIDYLLHQLINAYMLAQDAAYIGKQGMVFVCPEYLAVLFHARHQQASLLKPVNFHADGVGAHTKLFGQSTQVPMQLRYEE